MGQPIQELLVEIGNGQFAFDANETMNKMLERVFARADADGNASGELTIKLKFKGDNKGRVEITGETTAKMPAAPKSKEVRWLNRGGELVREDPRQGKLPLARNANKRDEEPPKKAAGGSNVAHLPVPPRKDSDGNDGEGNAN